MNKMYMDLDMFCFSIKHNIKSQGTSTLIITPQNRDWRDIVIPSLMKIDWSHTIFVAAWAKVWYFASIDEWATTFCFWELQVSKFHAK